MKTEASRACLAGRHIKYQGASSHVEQEREQKPTQPQPTSQRGGNESQSRTCSPLSCYVCMYGCEAEHQLLPTAVVQVELKGLEVAVLYALTFLPEKLSVSARCIIEP